MIIKRKTKPMTGDRKRITKFLLFPRWTNDAIYWLGTYELIYRYDTDHRMVVASGITEWFTRWQIVYIGR